MSRFFDTISETFETSYAIIYGDVKHFDSLVEPQIDLESERFAVDICDFGVL